MVFHLLAIIAATALAQEPPCAADRVLTSAAEIQALTFDECEKCPPFTISGRITAPDFPNRICILTDGTGSITAVARPGIVWKAGDIVRAKGVARPWEGGTKALGYSFVRAEISEYEIIGHFNVPPPERTTPEEILRGTKDLRSVTIRGVVTDAFRDEIDKHFNWLYISDSGSRVAVTFHDPTMDQGALDGIVDAVVEVSGVCFPYDNGYRRFLKSHLQIRSFDAIRIIEPAPADPFAAPEIGNLSKSSKGPNDIDRRCRASGKVIVSWRRNNILIETKTGTRIHVRTRKACDLPRSGSTITVAGFIRKNAFFATLGDAVFRIEAEGDTPADEPRFIGTGELVLDGYGLNPRSYGQTVRLSGTVKSIVSALTANGSMVVESDGYAVPVEIGTHPPPEIDSVIELTGVCMLTAEPDDGGSGFGRLGGFSIIPRSDADIRTISNPPWYTTRRLLTVLSILILALIGILIWNTILRAMVERRGHALAREQVARTESELKVRERTRLAVELHDSIAQNLTGVSMELDTAGQLSTDGQPEMRRHLSIASRALEACRIELRNCLWDLRSNALEEEDINKAILIAAKHHIGNARVSVRFNVPRRRLSDDMAHALIRIVRELTTNAIRHGHADHVQIAGSLDGDKLLFSVTDNGTGFDPDSHPGIGEGHFGLQGIRERIDLFSGEMDIQRRTDGGMRIVIALTLPSKETNPEAI